MIPIGSVLARSEAAEQRTFTCQICRAERPYAWDARFPFTPNLCNACESARDSGEAARERCRRGIAVVPYPRWDKALGNSETLRIVTRACASAGSVMVVGDTGTGKTRALCQATLTAMNAGKWVEWRNCGEWLDAMAAKAGESMAEYVRAKALAAQGDVLVLDDLGKGKVTERTASAVFDIVDRALVVGCAIWVTTNHKPEGIEAKFGQEYGAPLVRRLVEVCSYVEV